jgi:hypothetical protein
VDGKLLFEIPVYRSSFDDYAKEMEDEKTEEVRRAAEGYDRNLLNLHPSASLREAHLKRAAAFFNAHRWYGWHYNDAIGWIRLKGNWDVIKADYYFAGAKRIVRRAKRRTFEWRGKILELWLPPEASSANIYENLLHELQQLRRKAPFKGRYVDLEAFQNIGPFIDWRRAVAESSAHGSD